ncbi:FAD-binding oxidoreductase [Acuticoccus sp. MNP-M23]|uniref:FAD-binding oxidoreductase n=1 Tax=Acuticoccus sp. MNP-M23 TaxID=3072793 RepID=UPI00281684A6|nr:FAD-binding oxidoreductase [Acuticoccus sp. MNP-M23]WMS42520.1 FAD-binding oxidoreductase [Acuticoccus sp. MNP-M23]
MSITSHIPTDKPDFDALRKALSAELGDSALVTDRDAMQPYLTEWRHLYHGATPFVVRPADTEGVATALRLAAKFGVAIVPQSGNTGLVGGQMPSESGEELLISTDRLTKIETVDPAGNTLLCGAGTILADVQSAAEEAGRLFPLSLASEGSARIGGLISTNAGGTGVLAYGNMRDQVLGLEVVLADGRVWNGLRALRKDNTGYDLKHLFIGAEGTLGLVTRAMLKLRPLPTARDVAMVGVADPAAALTLLGMVQSTLGEAITAFELIPKFGIEMVLRHGAGTRNPFETIPEWVVLIEASTFSPDRPMREPLETALMAAYEAGVANDALVAQSIAEAADFWRLRELLSEVQSFEGGSIKHDVSVPIHALPAFLAEGTAAALEAIPGCRPVPFGHLGDGNIHFNFTQPEGADKDAFLAQWDKLNTAVHAVVAKHHGSIAAEHGVGRLKAKLVPTVRSPLELEMMRKIKSALDPDGRMNPGRILPLE